MFEKILLIALFTLLIHTIETLSYAVRLAGIRTGKLAVSLSLFNIMVLVSRTAYLIQAPLTASLVDQAKVTMNLSLLKDQLRMVLGSATLGSILGIILLPTFVALFSRAIAHFEEAGSIPLLMRNVVSKQKLTNARSYLRLPGWEMLSRLRIGGIPKRILLLNIIITAIYTVGILSALYASLLAPEYQSTAQMSSGVINGIATILLVIFVDPKVALLTEQVLQGTQNQSDIHKLVGILTISRAIGTVLSQALLVPAAFVIIWFCMILV